MRYELKDLDGGWLIVDHQEESFLKLNCSRHWAMMVVTALNYWTENTEGFEGE